MAAMKTGFSLAAQSAKYVYNREEKRRNGQLWRLAESIALKAGSWKRRKPAESGGEAGGSWRNGGVRGYSEKVKYDDIILLLIFIVMKYSVLVVKYCIPSCIEMMCAWWYIDGAGILFSDYSVFDIKWLFIKWGVFYYIHCCWHCTCIVVMLEIIQYSIYSFSYRSIYIPFIWWPTDNYPSISGTRAIPTKQYLWYRGNIAICRYDSILKFLQYWHCIVLLACLFYRDPAGRSQWHFVAMA